MFFVMLWIYSCVLLHRVGQISANSYVGHVWKPASGTWSIYIFQTLATDIISVTTFCWINIFGNFFAHFF